MRKVYMLIIGLLLVFEHRAHAQVDDRRLSNQSTPEIKFGPYGTLAFSWQAGIFGEYKFNEVVGLRIVPSLFKDVYGLRDLAVTNGVGALVQSVYVGSPILVSFYPGEARQFCLFGGVQVGYLIGGTASFVNINTIKTGLQDNIKDIYKDLINSTTTQLLDINEQDKVHKLGLNLMAGSDYHFSSGFMLGLLCAYGLIDVIEAKESMLHWGGQLVLGYNFGTFLK